MKNHTQLNDLLTAYEVDVRFPDVSGMEHLDMLLTRSKLATADISPAHRRATCQSWRRPIVFLRRKPAASMRLSDASPTSSPGVGRKVRCPNSGGGILTCWRRRRTRSAGATVAVA